MRNEEFSAGQPADDLDDHSKKVLDFAGRHYNHEGKQHEDIVSEFGYLPTTYFMRLSRLLDNPHAMAYAPQTVKRHQRIVDEGLKKWGRSPRYSDGY